MLRIAERAPSPAALRYLSPRSGERSLPQIQVLEKVVALVVDDDEGGEIDHFDTPDRFHAELGIFDALDFLDAMLGEVCRRPADRGEIEAAVLLAGLADG